MRSKSSAMPGPNTLPLGSKSIRMERRAMTAQWPSAHGPSSAGPAHQIQQIRRYIHEKPTDLDTDHLEAVREQAQNRT
jgi:hypothetical protein